MIPKTIHLIWLGSKLPENFKKLADDIKSINSDYEVIEWNDYNIDFELNKHDLFYNTTNQGSKSDILRFEILMRFGGIYMDYDFIQIKKFDELLDCDFFAGSGDGELVWNSIMGSIPNHKICSDFLNGLKDDQPVGAGNHNVQQVMATTGPYYLTNIFNQNKDHGRVRLLDKNYFFPFDAGRREEVRDLSPESIAKIKSYTKPETVCIHFHTCTWQ